MSKLSPDAYDAVIIGSGIGGLVCGCYLAKAGMKVLICEQHVRPGGYCSSFRRGKFIFDAAAHTLGGYSTGILGRVFKEIGLDHKLTILRNDPSNSIITPDNMISFWADQDRTIYDIQMAFPDEATPISRFFYDILSPNTRISAGLKSVTFMELLDRYFRNPKLKAVLAFPLYGNAGLPPSRLSAFIGMSIFKEYLIDGGYHPNGGMQVLSDALADRFKDFGGCLMLSARVSKIRIKEDKAVGVILSDGEFIAARNIVSNGDARQTFIQLIGRRYLNNEFAMRLENMEQSLSMFILYLGLDGNLLLPRALKNNLWYLCSYDLDKSYWEARAGNFKWFGGCLIQVSSDRQVLEAFIFAPFKSAEYWRNHKSSLMEMFIKRLEDGLIPDLSRHILYKEAATPQTLKQYTSNYKGASFGWACTPEQLVISDFSHPSFIKSLFLAGHWTTKGIGTPGVTYVGYDIAKTIIRKEMRHV